MSNSRDIEKALEWFDGGEMWVKQSYFEDEWKYNPDTGEEEFVKLNGACLVGGLILAVFNEQREDYAYAIPCTNTISDVVCELFPDRVVGSGREIDTITTFNDNSQTTFEDITLVLKHSIERERENEAKKLHGPSAQSYGWESIR